MSDKTALRGNRRFKVTAPFQLFLDVGSVKSNASWGSSMIYGKLWMPHTLDVGDIVYDFGAWGDPFVVVNGVGLYEAKVELPTRGVFEKDYGRDPKARGFDKMPMDKLEEIGYRDPPGRAPEGGIFEIDEVQMDGAVAGPNGIDWVLPEGHMASKTSADFHMPDSYYEPPDEQEFVGNYEWYFDEQNGNVWRAQAETGGAEPGPYPEGESARDYAYTVEAEIEEYGEDEVDPEDDHFGWSVDEVERDRRTVEHGTAPTLDAAKRECERVMAEYGGHVASKTAADTWEIEWGEERDDGIAWYYTRTPNGYYIEVGSEVLDEGYERAWGDIATDKYPDVAVVDMTEEQQEDIEQAVQEYLESEHSIGYVIQEDWERGGDETAQWLPDDDEDFESVSAAMDAALAKARTLPEVGQQTLQLESAKQARDVDDKFEDKKCTCTKNEHGNSTSVVPKRSCPVHGHLVDSRKYRQAALGDDIAEDMGENGMDTPEPQVVEEVDEYSRRLFPFRGVNVAVMAKDWKESWDAQEMAGLIQALQNSSAGRIVVTEFDDGSDSNWLVLHPDSLDIDPNDEEVIDYLSYGGSDEDVDETWGTGFEEDEAERVRLKDINQRFRDAPKESSIKQAAPAECPECGGPAEVWADKSGGVTVNFACDNPDCKSGKPPWDTERPTTAKTAQNMLSDFMDYFGRDVMNRFRQEGLDYGDGLTLDWQQFSSEASARLQQTNSPEEALEWMMALASFEPYGEWDNWEAVEEISREIGKDQPDPALLQEALDLWKRHIRAKDGGDVYEGWFSVLDEISRDPGTRWGKTAMEDYDPEIADRCPDCGSEWQPDPQGEEGDEVCLHADDCPSPEAISLRNEDQGYDSSQNAEIPSGGVPDPDGPVWGPGPLRNLSFVVSSGERFDDFESARYLLIQTIEDAQRTASAEASPNFSAAIEDVETWTGPDTIFVDTKTGAAEFWIKQADDDPGQAICSFCGHESGSHKGDSCSQCSDKDKSHAFHKQVRARTAGKCEKCGESNDKVRTYTYSVDGKPKELHADCADNLNRDHDVKKKKSGRTAKVCRNCENGNHSGTNGTPGCSSKSCTCTCGRKGDSEDGTKNQSWG